VAESGGTSVGGTMVPGSGSVAGESSTSESSDGICCSQAEAAVVVVGGCEFSISSMSEVGGACESSISDSSDCIGGGGGLGLCQCQCPPGSTITYGSPSSGVLGIWRRMRLLGGGNI
jgi:hypothetical protein